MRGRSRNGAALLVGEALVVLLAACSFSWASRGSGTFSGSSGSSAGSTSSAGSPSVSSAQAAATVSLVSCSGGTCSVTLGGKGSQAQVLGTGIAFGEIRDGRATVRVGARDVTLAEGQTMTVDRLAVRCTEVAQATVTLVLSPG